MNRFHVTCLIPQLSFAYLLKVFQRFLFVKLVRRHEHPSDEVAGGPINRATLIEVIQTALLRNVLQTRLLKDFDWIID